MYNNSVVEEAKVNLFLSPTSTEEWA